MSTYFGVKREVCPFRKLCAFNIQHSTASTSVSVITLMSAYARTCNLALSVQADLNPSLRGFIRPLRSGSNTKLKMASDNEHLLNV